jgi:hypothetical protein
MANKDWRSEAMAVLKAELAAMSGAEGDNSLLAGINEEAVRGLAGLALAAGQLGPVHGDQLAAVLTIIADNMRRADLAAQLAAIRAA